MIQLRLQNDFSVLIANVYMPCDKGRMHKCNDTFTEVLELIET